MLELADALERPVSAEDFYKSIVERHTREGWGTRRRKQAEQVLMHLPRVRDKIVRQADDGLAGMQTLPGTGGKPFFVGNPPRWQEMPITPPDEEYVWTLNRMHQWEWLLKGYLLTGDGRYAEKVGAELDDWVGKCPCPGVSKPQSYVKAWRILEVGIRMFGTWRWVADVLVGTPHMNAGRFSRYICSLYEHALSLATVSPQLWPKANHNHYIMEMLGLLGVAARFGELKHAATWRPFAVHELERCAAAQFGDGGGQLEGCPHYHNVCVNLFYKATQLAADAGLALSAATLERVGAAVNYSLASMRPTGESVAWGDSDLNHDGVRSMMQAEVMFPGGPWLRVATELAGRDRVQQIIEEHVWDVPEVDQLRAAMDWRGEVTLPRAYASRGTEQAMLRSGWGHEDLYVFIGCAGDCQNGHAHQDTASVDVTGLGRGLLTDPGRYTYREGEDRRRYKSATWHSTLTVNRKEPFEYVNRWRFKDVKESRLEWVSDTGRVVAACCMQRNFEPAVHRRCVAIVDGKVVVVMDELSGIAADASVQRYFHLDATNVAWDAAQQCAVSEADDVRMAIWTTPISSGEVLAGTISPCLDVERESRRLLLEDHGGKAGTRYYAAVIVPFKAGADRPAVKNLKMQQEGGEPVCQFELAGGMYSLAWRGSEVVLL